MRDLGPELRWYVLEGETLVPLEGGFVGNAVPWAMWAQEHPDAVNVGHDEIEVETDTGIRSILVSTKLLGFPLPPFTADPPLVFETMILGGAHHMWQRRTSTLAEARTAHATAVELVRGTHA